MGLLTGAGLFQPGAVAVGAPLPGIVEEKDGRHPSFFQLTEDDVHSGEILIRGQDPEVVQTEAVQGVQLRGEALRIAEGQLRSIPDVGADEICGFAVPYDPSVFDGPERLPGLASDDARDCK